MAVEQLAELHTGSSALVALSLPASTVVEPEVVPAVAGLKRGALIAWPAQVSATLRRVKEAITPNNAEVLRLLESPSANET